MYNVGCNPISLCRPKQRALHINCGWTRRLLIGKEGQRSGNAKWKKEDKKINNLSSKCCEIQLTVWRKTLQGPGLAPLPFILVYVPLISFHTDEVTPQAVAFHLLNILPLCHKHTCLFQNRINFRLTFVCVSIYTYMCCLWALSCSIAPPYLSYLGLGVGVRGQWWAMPVSPMVCNDETGRTQWN